MEKNKEIRSTFVVLGIKLNNNHAVPSLIAHICLQDQGQAPKTNFQGCPLCSSPALFQHHLPPVFYYILQSGNTSLVFGQRQETSP